jgi:[glutamine synthetase] adenylyltransferase / [glutamine synthetase]-adenylyl-L-tyrosine phosphorylase
MADADQPAASSRADGVARDTPVHTTEAALARLGVDRTAVPWLRLLGLWEEDRPPDHAWPVIEDIAASPNPDLAVRALARLAERRPEAWAALVAGGRLVARAAVVAGTSEALGDLMALRPDALTVLTGDPPSRTAADVLDECRAQLVEERDPATALAFVQRRGLLRIAARDLLGYADTPSVTAELADLAEGVLTAALEHVADDRSTVSVIGMGKLGGRELNYISDVDVVFVHDGDWAAATATCERFLRLLGTTTPLGRPYEVDPNLRPEGRDGPLVRSLDSFRAYYERWAQPWEFQALLKARPVAGGPDLGRAFTDLVEPFLWPDRLSAAAVEEIQRLKAVVERSREVQRAGARQVKLAPGGLRDIEFAVQLLQLVHGRHDVALRVPNTLAALAALAEGGYVGEDDAALFAEAYVFLRTVEHRLQLFRLRRTHTLPSSEAERGRLARSTGYRTNAQASALEHFETTLRRMQGHVRTLHEKLFYRPLLARFAEVSADERLTTDAGGRLAEDAARDRLAALGFSTPEAALVHLEALAAGVTRRARLFRTLLPAILPTLAEAPDPDGGLAAFRSLADRLGDSPFFLRTLRDAPPVGELLARVLGSSRLVGEWLERQPEVFGLLADVPGLAKRLEEEDYRRLADGLLRRSDREAAADALRRLKRREVARTAARDLGGYADVTDVAAELTGLAEACLHAAVELVVPDGLRLAVIGMGRLGGGELGYASDLDILLVFEPGDAREEAVRAAERSLRLLSAITPEGQAFRVDPNLRPEGKDGPLVRTLDSYRIYYERWGEPWEFQALTQARPVAGDADLGAAFVEAVSDLVYPQDPPAQRLQAVRRMKARVERERAADGPQPRPGAPRATRPRHGGLRQAPRADRATAGLGRRVDLKLGPGGLSDVEWTVQLLLLRHGGRVPSLRRPGTLAGLAACEAAGVLGPDDAEWLRAGWLLLTRLRNALYLAGFHDSAVLPAGRPAQERLARMLGYPAPGAQALLEGLGRATRRIRKVHEQRFYGA